MATTTADFKLSDFDLTAETLSPVVDDYSTTWTLVNPFRSSSYSYGSTLQKNIPANEEYYDDSALRGDSYVIVPQANAVVTAAFFEAKPVDYGIVKLKWSVGMALASSYGAEPVPTEVMIRWDTLGEPQTVANGSLVTTIRSNDIRSEMEHQNLPDGTWIYYSIFVKYSSTAYRHWYEKVASVHVQTPYRYGSTDTLWERIPRHYRIQDGFDGPLRHLLDIFGWDIDRIRTLAHHQMVTRDPMLATTEALDELANEVGLPMSSVDLGTERLRNYLNDIGYLRQAKGTLAGVREAITAITGSDVDIKPTTESVITEFQSVFATGSSVTTSASVTPTSGNWVFYSPVTISASVPFSNGVILSKPTSTDYDIVVAKTKVSNVNQSSWYTLFYDVTNKTGASVVGVGFSSTVPSGEGISIDQTNGAVLSLPSGTIATTSIPPDDWYQAPVSLGLSCDGTLTEKDMYLYIYMVFGTSGTLKLDNIKLKSNDRYPYEIYVYSQRVNLCRDPQFNYEFGPNFYWEYETSGNSVVASKGSKRANFQATGASTTAASVTLSTNPHAGPSDTTIPIQLGIQYFFSITDLYDHIVSVSLISETYGTIATASDTFAEKGSDEQNTYNVRKTWRLVRPYEAPWLPENVTDCYLEINMVVPGGQTATVFKPILEPINSSGTYFDGDEINGGWLAGPTASGGVSDYRWGDDGRHVSFSYFTSDYRRTVVTAYRMLDTILPVTQTDDPTTFVLFDRVRGYEGEGRP